MYKPVEYILDSGEQYTVPTFSSFTFNSFCGKIPVGSHPTQLQFDGSQNISLQPLKDAIKIRTQKCETHLANFLCGEETLLSDLTLLYLTYANNRKTVLKTPAKVSISIPNLDAYNTVNFLIVKKCFVFFQRSRVLVGSQGLKHTK